VKKLRFDFGCAEFFQAKLRAAYGFREEQVANLWYRRQPQGALTGSLARATNG
jgi:hypothetical protein